MNDGLLTDVGVFDVSDPVTGRVLPTLGAVSGAQVGGGIRGRFERPGRSDRDSERSDGISSGRGTA